MHGRGHHSTRVTPRGKPTLALLLILALLATLALPVSANRAAAQDGDGGDSTGSDTASGSGIVSTVEGEPIPRAQFHDRVEFVRWQYLRELEALYEATGGNLALVTDHVRSLVNSLNDPVALGEDVLHLLERERLLWQQGEALDLTPTAEDAQEQEAAFFSLWTNIPADQIATSEEAQAFINEWYAGATETSGISADDIRILFETEALRQRLYEHVASNVPRDEEAVHTQHILCAFHPGNVSNPAPPTEDERAAAKNCAESALIRLANGETFSAVAMELSDDLASAQRGGDVGWQLLSYLAEPYAEAAREADLNTVNGPIETSYGYHVLEVLDREMRQLSDEEYEDSQQGYFSLWVQSLYDNATIERSPDWDANSPTTPDLSLLDADIQAAIDDLLQTGDTTG